MSLAERDDALDQKMQDNSVDMSIEALVKDAARRRRQIILLAVSLLVDFWLTIGLAVLAFQARDTSLSVQKGNNAVIASCMQGNEFKKTEAALWQHIISISTPSQQLTPEQEVQRQKTLADFQDYLKTTFAPRDCNNIIQK